jgi:hypothetical protein
MKDDGGEFFAIDKEELPAAQLNIPSASNKPVELANENDTLSVSALVDLCREEIQSYRRREPSNGAHGLELLRRAIERGNQDAWAGLQQCLEESVRGWLRCHPHRGVAWRWESEENYVALAFERFWQATARQQVVFKTFAGALAYLRASLHGAILDTLRSYSRPREISLPEPGEPGEPYVEDRIDSSEVWEILQKMLPSEREQRLAYLLYHCGLKPREIVRFCQEEWSDIQEIYRLRRNILERLLRNANQFRWRFHLQEQV